jgi:hypothetical protein
MKLMDLQHVDFMLLEKVGREFQHLEDLVFVDGSTGAKNALRYLRELAAGNSYPMIKWDGNPTIYFGRLPTGKFVLVGKNAWLKKQLLNTPDELRDFVMTTGKGEDWRSEFADSLVEMWRLFETATPKSFRGFLYCDVLYHPGNPYKRNTKTDRFEFTPNLVTYGVSIASDLGARMVRARVAVAAHSHAREFGSSDKNIMSAAVLDGFAPSVIVLPPITVPEAPSIDIDYLSEIQSEIAINGAALDEFLSPVPRLSNPASIIYQFTNSALPIGYQNLEARFSEWIDANLSEGQASLFRNKIAENPKGFRALFRLVALIGEAKNSAIDQLDQATPDIVASTGERPGGEGYVDAKHKVKLVPRTRWNPRGI